MRPVSAKPTRALNAGCKVIASDNSGARIVRIFGVKKGKVSKKTQQYMKVGDHVKVSVRAGKPEMKGEVFDAIVIRQKKPYRRKTGERVMFEDNAVALLKDDKGNPKGTQIKGAVAREVAERWKQVGKIAQFVL
jgi:large subunit ribosomal protein L14